MLYLELLIQGLIQGSMYAIIAVGLTLVYGLLRILHVAHAGLFALGAYLGLLITNATGNLALGMLLSSVMVGIGGMLMYRLCYQPILNRPPYVALIASIGMFVAMEEIFRLIFGPYGLTYKNPPLQSQITLIGSTSLLWAAGASPRIALTAKQPGLPTICLSVFIAPLCSSDRP